MSTYEGSMIPMSVVCIEPGDFVIDDEAVHGYRRVKARRKIGKDWTELTFDDGSARTVAWNAVLQAVDPFGTS